MFWNNIHKYVGHAIFGLSCLGAGNIAATAEFKLTDLWKQNANQAGEIHQLKAHEIPSLKAQIPHGTADKAQSPTITPNCIPNHPAPE